jgi:hypothetical protein
MQVRDVGLQFGDGLLARCCEARELIELPEFGFDVGDR